MSGAVEIGLGFRYLPLVHLLGHACLRTLQFLRAPALLQDFQTLENAIGDHLPRAAAPWERLSEGPRAWLYRVALERGYLDAFLRKYVSAPATAAFQWCDAMERRWTDFLAGEAGNPRLIGCGLARVSHAWTTDARE